jgi:uncharacterized membrane protein
MDEGARVRRQTEQLRRLGTLTDVIYALAIWRLFQLLPKPWDPDWKGGTPWEILDENLPVFLVILIGLVVVIIYWSQSNELFSALERTDGRHTALTIIQIFCLLLFLYTIALGTVLEGSVWTRVFESAAAASMGIAGGWAWSYAARGRRLLAADVSDEYARDLAIRMLAEPGTALLTIPVAFAGGLYWEIAWLSYPLIAVLLRRSRFKAS